MEQAEKPGNIHYTYKATQCESLKVPEKQITSEESLLIVLVGLKNRIIRYREEHANRHIPIKPKEDICKKTAVQINVGNCYLVAGINSLYRNPLLSEFLKKSIITAPKYGVNLSPETISFHNQLIDISEEELQPQINPDYEIQRTYKNYTVFEDGRNCDLITDDKRKVLMPVDGLIEMKILEAAYIKHKHGKVDRLLEKGGDTSDFYDFFLGDSIAELKFFINFQLPGLFDFCKEYIFTLPSNTYVATLASKINNNTLSSGRRIWPNHTYALSSINHESKIVTILDTNPKSPTKLIDITYQELYDNFSYINGVIIDFDKLDKYKSAQ